MKILFASAEAHPLIKTGGLADVAGSLPRAIRNQRHDIRLVIPAYQSVLKQVEKYCLVAHLELKGLTQPVRILAGRLPGSTVTVYLVEEFLENTTAPPYEGEVTYGDRAEHCWNGDHTQPNAISRLRYHQMFIPKFVDRMLKTAPAGADLTSWRY